MNRVWVTRDEKKDGPLCSALRACYLIPILEPVLERIVVADITADLRSLSADDWLVLTSIFAIENVPADLARIPRVAVVGQASKVVAEARGFRVKLVSRHGTGSSLFNDLRKQAAGTHVVYPRSALAEIPPDRHVFAEFTAPILYETRPREFDLAISQDVDVITVTSASAVRALNARLRIATLKTPLASIGVTTTAAIVAGHGTVWAQPPWANFVELARTIARRSGVPND